MELIGVDNARSRCPIHRPALSIALASVLGLSACDDVATEQKPERKLTKSAKAPPEPPPVAEPQPPPPPPAPRPKTLPTFEEAAAKAAEIYAEHRRSFYCSCTYTRQERVSRTTCGYATRADDSLAKKIVWDRIVPQREYGARRPCWTQPLCTTDAGVRFSGVQCCSQIDGEFRTIDLDLHNFVPVIGEISEDRSNYPFGEIDGEARLYGRCDFEIDTAAGLSEPAEAVRGDIARAYLYMSESYGDAVELSLRQKQMFHAWSAADPPDAWEQERNAAITAVQGIANPHVSPPGEDAPKNGQ